jgi:hypothetical protein
MNLDGEVSLIKRTGGGILNAVWVEKEKKLTISWIGKCCKAPKEKINKFPCLIEFELEFLGGVCHFIYTP